MVPQAGRKCERTRPFQSLLERRARGGVTVGLDGASFFLFLLLLIKRGRMCTERRPLEQSRPTACLGGETYYTTSIKFLIDRIPAFRRALWRALGAVWRLEDIFHNTMQFNYLWGNLRSKWFQIAVCTLGRIRETKECGKALCRIVTCRHGRTHLRLKTSVNGKLEVREGRSRADKVLCSEACLQTLSPRD